MASRRIFGIRNTPLKPRFHVSSLSSAHVYVRLNDGEDWMQMEESLVTELCALVKHNSIEGCKKECVDVVYTPCVNLKKSEDMDVGQVSFKRKKDVIKVKDVPKHKEIIKLIYKSKREEYPDLQKLRAEREKEIILKKKQETRQEKLAKNQLEKERQADKMKWEDAALAFDPEYEGESNKEVRNMDDSDDDFM